MTRDDAIKLAWMAYYRAPNGTSQASHFTRALAEAGYAVVPVEESDEMIDAGVGAISPGTWGEIVSAAYRAMVLAASQPGGVTE